MERATNFYTWWTNKVKGNYISDQEFENVLEKFEPETA